MMNPVAVAAMVTAVFTFLMTFMACRAMNTRDALKAAGLTKNSAAMYRRAVRIIRRLDGLTELDGEFAADILTPETKEQVSRWVADYRKEMNDK